MIKKIFQLRKTKTSRYFQQTDKDLINLRFFSVYFYEKLSKPNSYCKLQFLCGKEDKIINFMFVWKSQEFRNWFENDKHIARILCLNFLFLDFISRNKTDKTYY